MFNCLIELSSGIFASCSADKTIKLFSVSNNNYKLKQTLNDHSNWIFTIIELSNKSLVSGSSDHTIIFYNKDNNQYMKDYQLKCKNDSQCANIIQTKENEIAYDEYDNNLICFYDFFERKIITEINNIHISNIRSFIMIAKDLLLITGREILYIIYYKC